MRPLGELFRSTAEIILGGFLIPLVVVLIVFGLIVNLIRAYPLPLLICSALIGTILLAL